MPTGQSFGRYSLYVVSQLAINTGKPGELIDRGCNVCTVLHPVVNFEADVAL